MKKIWYGVTEQERKKFYNDRRTPEYLAWDSMLQRCNNPNNIRYPDYGGRSIKVCESWLKFSNFYADMGSRELHTSLDRIDVNGNYCKENCKWSTQKEQYENKRNNKWVELNNKNMLVSQAIKILNTGIGAIYQRINKGVTHQQAINDYCIKHNVMEVF